MMFESNLIYSSDKTICQKTKPHKIKSFNFDTHPNKQYVKTVWNVRFLMIRLTITQATTKKKNN